MNILRPIQFPIDPIQFSIQSLSPFSLCMLACCLGVAPVQALEHINDISSQSALNSANLPPNSPGDLRAIAPPQILSQVAPQPDTLPSPQDVLPPSVEFEVPLPRPKLPPPEQLLDELPNQTAPGETSPDIPGTVVVKEFRVEGSTVFSPEELALVTDPFTNRPLTFPELLQARSAVTKLYVDRGYITSGAYIPAGQTLDEGVVTIRVLEGQLETITVKGLRRFNEGYIRRRVARAAGTPLNVPKLLEGLQSLQLDPLIVNLSAELAAGSGPGRSTLTVVLQEKDVFDLQVQLDNGRSPSVGSARGRLRAQRANILGEGDVLGFTFTKTDGSEQGALDFTVPINARNGTIGFNFQTSISKIVEEPFDELNIEADSFAVDFTFRQPIIQKPTREFAVGVSFSRQESDITWIFEDDPVNPVSPNILSPGANEEGETRISALRFFQEWTERDSKNVLSARSQLSVGVPWFFATNNDTDPDSTFVSWQGQFQWVKLLAPDTLFLFRTNAQFADRTLLPLEQFGTGGSGSVRGYRQDQLLSDNGLFLSAELRLPLFRAPKKDMVLQLIPFFDYGKAWNNGDRTDPEPLDLASVGLGLLFQFGDRLTARADYGVRLNDAGARGESLQEDGFLITIIANPF